MQWANLSPEQFELLCGRLLQAEGFNLISPSGRSRDIRLDFLVNPPNQDVLWVVECKHHRSFLSLAARKATHKLLASQQLVGASHGLLIVSSNLSPRSTEQLAQYDNISVWDRTTLQELLERHPVIRDEFFLLTQVQTSIRRRIGDPIAEDPRAAELLEQLSRISPGRDHWREYEDTCIDIFNHVFIPPFRTPRIQSISEDGLDRRDAIYPISIGDPVWDRIQSECRARMVVAEFKNLADAPGQKEVESIQQYLYPTAMRSLGVLCARRSASEAALKARRRAWVESDKLIVLLCDEDLQEILALKAMNDNPAQVIDAQIDEFFMELCP